MNEKILFNQLGLSKRVLEAIAKKGFEEPSPIQALTIPAMLNNERDIIAQAQTGTGKTAAFGLPMIELIDDKEKSVQAIVLAPTRELAIQVSEEINSLKGDSSLHVIPIYGGQSITQQLRLLKRGVHIVVGTPGRVIDHLKRRTLDLRNIKFLILDEADEMLNMGFIDDLEIIMENTNDKKRTLLFSATMPERIKRLARKYMKNHDILAVRKQQLTTKLTEQIYYEVKSSEKFEALCRIIDIEDDFYGLIFCRTKNEVDNVRNHLADRGYDVDAIHGDIVQKKRESILGRFKKKQVNVLVATDVAARGIDVNNLTHVINYSLPQDPESYVHRIGRTGRAGNQGTAITFITPSEYKKLMFIQRVAKTDIKKSRIPNIQDIIELKRDKINEDLASINSEEVDTAYFNWTKKLLANSSPNHLIAKLLAYCFDNDLNPDSYNKIQDFSRNKRETERRDLGDIEGRARLFVAMGKKDNTSPSELVKFIIKNTGVKNSAINEVEVYNSFSFITVPFKEAKIILKIFKNKNGKSLVVKAKNKR